MPYDPGPPADQGRRGDHARPAADDEPGAGQYRAFGADQYRADQYRADQYRPDQYRADQYGADQYGADPYRAGPDEPGEPDGTQYGPAQNGSRP
jgi:hypothetical protein